MKHTNQMFKKTYVDPLQPKYVMFIMICVDLDLQNRQFEL